jgi:hypothetical protein
LRRNERKNEESESEQPFFHDGKAAKVAGVFWLCQPKSRKGKLGILAMARSRVDDARAQKTNTA